MTERAIEFWFEFGSTYTYLTVARLESVAPSRGIRVDWRPFLLMPIMIEQGMPEGPFLPYPNKLRYMWRDLERRAQRHGVNYRKPSVYPPNTLLTARVGRLGQNEGWCAAFTKEVFRLHWTEDVIIGTDENIRRSISSTGKNADEVITRAQSDDINKPYVAKPNTPRHLGSSVHPFIVGDEVFWGDDRLEEAMEFRRDLVGTL